MKLFLVLASVPNILTFKVSSLLSFDNLFLSGDVASSTGEAGSFSELKNVVFLESNDDFLDSRVPCFVSFLIEPRLALLFYYK